jgi:hypothetical protein
MYLPKHLKEEELLPIELESLRVYFSSVKKKVVLDVCPILPGEFQ